MIMINILWPIALSFTSSRDVTFPTYYVLVIIYLGSRQVLFRTQNVTNRVLVASFYDLSKLFVMTTALLQ